MTCLVDFYIEFSNNSPQETTRVDVHLPPEMEVVEEKGEGPRLLVWTNDDGEVNKNSPDNVGKAAGSEGVMWNGDHTEL